MYNKPIKHHTRIMLKSVQYRLYKLTIFERISILVHSNIIYVYSTVYTKYQFMIKKFNTVRKYLLPQTIHETHTTIIYTKKAVTQIHPRNQ